MFAVVEKQDKSMGSQIRDEGVDRATTIETNPRTDYCRYHLSVGDYGEVHEPNGVQVLVGCMFPYKIFGGACGEARFPDPSRADKRHKALGFEHPCDLVEIALSSDERGEENRQFYRRWFATRRTPYGGRSPTGRTL
jgi:hypothetical protein